MLTMSHNWTKWAENVANTANMHYCLSLQMRYTFSKAAFRLLKAISDEINVLKLLPFILHVFILTYIHKRQRTMSTSNSGGCLQSHFLSAVTPTPQLFQPQINPLLPSEDPSRFEGKRPLIWIPSLSPRRRKCGPDTLRCGNTSGAPGGLREQGG